MADDEYGFTRGKWLFLAFLLPLLLVGLAVIVYIPVIMWLQVFFALWINGRYSAPFCRTPSSI